MTITSSAPAKPDAEAVAADASESTGRRRGLLSSNYGVIGVAFTILGVVLLALVLDIGVLSGFRHSRDQQVELALFRYELANSTAPVGQLDPDGHLLEWATPVAYLEIPNINVTEVVGEGTTSSVLMSGPGHRRDTPMPGQPGDSVVYGRQATYGGPFRNIASLKPGALIKVTTGQGVSKFRVLDVRYPGQKVPPMVLGSGRLTLVSAAGPDYRPNKTVYVDAALTSAVLSCPQRPLTTAGLLPSEQAMAGESTAWLPLVLWAQLLLLAALALTWLYVKWGKWQAWLVGVPLLAVLGFAVADQVARLLPNLL